MSDSSEMVSEVIRVYGHLEIAKVLHIPSSAIHMNYYPIKEEDHIGVIPAIEETSLKLDIYARDQQEGIKVAAAFLANTRLRVARSFGSRHGPLLYLLPILHLLTFLLIMGISAYIFGFAYGILSGTIAAVSSPKLIIWIASSLKRRRSNLKDNLEKTNLFGNSQEIDEVATWLKAKIHIKGYWIKRALFYECYFVPFTLLFVLLLQS
jgi:sensor histidine kinase YesM